MYVLPPESHLGEQSAVGIRRFCVITLLILITIRLLVNDRFVQTCYLGRLPFNFDLDVTEVIFQE